MTVEELLEILEEEEDDDVDVKIEDKEGKRTDIENIIWDADNHCLVFQNFKEVEQL